MPSWNSRGLRGSMLEDQINMTNQKYRETGLALVQKIPTPITPIEFNKDTRHITLAYFEQKSTVDYIGVVQGLPVCFDAKECAADTFSLQNLHEHQVGFMKEFEAQGGIAFILINFIKNDIFLYLRYADMARFWKRAKEGGRKSIRFDEFDTEYMFKGQGSLYIPYLKYLQKDLDARENQPDSKE